MWTQKTSEIYYRVNLINFFHFKKRNQGQTKVVEKFENKNGVFKCFF